MISTCLSIIQDSLSDSFATAVINFPSQTIASASFSVDGKSVNPLDKYGDIWDFLGAELSNPDIIQVILAVPTILGVRRENFIPVLMLEEDSIYFKIVLYLSKKKYCSFLYGPALVTLNNQSPIEVILLTVSGAKPEKNPLKIVFGNYHSYIDFLSKYPNGPEEPPPHKLMIIYPSLAKAYANFLFGTTPSLRLAAVAAGLIAQKDGLYYYMASAGIVHSSQDIVEFFRHRVASSRVVSGREVYIIEAGNHTRFDKIDQIPLKYAVAMQKYKEFLQPDAQRQKFALLTVCKLWNIHLFCERRSEEYLFRQPASSLIFDPEHSIDLLIEKAAIL